MEPFQPELKFKKPTKKNKKKLIYHFSLANIPPGDPPTFAYDFPRCCAYRSHRRGGAGRRTLIRPLRGYTVITPPKTERTAGFCGSLKIWRFFLLRFWRFNLTDGWLNIFEKSFGEIAEVFQDRRNGVHPGLNWENDDPQHSAPSNSSGFPKPELGRAILMEASGLKFTPPPKRFHRGFF